MDKKRSKGFNSSFLVISMACLVLVGVIIVLVPLEASAVSVGLELSLLVDVSGSVDSSEFNLQKSGYVNAFNNPAVLSAIQSNPTGAIAANLVYWSGASEQVQAVGWTLINDATSASAFASSINATTRPFGGATAIGSALSFATPLFSNNGFEGARLAIDVSGDGATNDGIASSIGRNNALAAGINSINGLVVGGDASVLNHYQTQVIGGTNPFALAVNSFEDFGGAIQNKFLREIPPNGGNGGNGGNGNVIPEPSTILLLGSGLAGLGAWRMRSQS